MATDDLPSNTDVGETLKDQSCRSKISQPCISPKVGQVVIYGEKDLAPEAQPATRAHGGDQEGGAHTRPEAAGKAGGDTGGGGEAHNTLRRSRCTPGQEDADESTDVITAALV